MIKKPLINNQIKARQVRLADDTGKQFGIVDIAEALKIAQERNLDLIQVTEKVDPPVCKLMEYGKYIYKQEKKERKTKKQTSGEVKGLRLSFNISPHDLETKTKQAEKFLKRGNMVRVELPLRGREKAFEQLAKEKMNKFVEVMNFLMPIKMGQEIKKGPKGLTMIILKNEQVKNQ